MADRSLSLKVIALALTLVAVTGVAAAANTVELLNQPAEIQFTDEDIKGEYNDNVKKFIENEYDSHPIVRVTNGSGDPVPDVEVNLSVRDSGSSIKNFSYTTGDEGYAILLFNVDNPGYYDLNVSIEGDNVTSRSFGVYKENETMNFKVLEHPASIQAKGKEIVGNGRFLDGENQYPTAFVWTPLKEEVGSSFEAEIRTVSGIDINASLKEKSGLNPETEKVSTKDISDGEEAVYAAVFDNLTIGGTDSYRLEFNITDEDVSKGDLVDGSDIIASRGFNAVSSGSGANQVNLTREEFGGKPMEDWDSKPVLDHADNSVYSYTAEVKDTDNNGVPGVTVNIKAEDEGEEVRDLKFYTNGSGVMDESFTIDSSGVYETNFSIVADDSSVSESDSVVSEFNISDYKIYFSSNWSTFSVDEPMRHVELEGDNISTADVFWYDASASEGSEWTEVNSISGLGEDPMRPYYFSPDVDEAYFMKDYGAQTDFERTLKEGWNLLGGYRADGIGDDLGDLMATVDSSTDAVVVPEETERPSYYDEGTMSNFDDVKNRISLTRYGHGSYWVYMAEDAKLQLWPEAPEG